MEAARRLNNLIERGFAALETGAYRESIRIGTVLKKLRHSSAFEILALAYLKQNKLARAIRVLEEGVAKAGRAWILWELLGNCYSDAGRYQKAEQTYQKALRVERCNRDVIHLNRAIAFDRAGKLSAAKYALRLISAPRLGRRAAACRIRIELELGNMNVARRLASLLARQSPRKDENYDSKTESEVQLACAMGLRTSAATKAMALRCAMKAADKWPGNIDALATIRELQNKNSGKARAFRFLVRGVWTGSVGKGHRPAGFYRTVEAAGSDQIDAFRYAKPFFPKRVRKTLSIEEVKPLNDPAIIRHGVYFLSSFFFYPSRRHR